MEHVLLYPLSTGQEKLWVTLQFQFLDLTQLLELVLVLVLVLVLALILIFFVHCLVHEDEEHALKHDPLSVKG